MNKVNLNNYEIFALDYIEGNLSMEDSAAFNLFLQNHPEIRNEINNLKNDPINFESDVEFDQKLNLKKEALLNEDINLSNYQNYFVAFHEGDLSDKSKSKVDEFVNQNTSTTEAFTLFSKIRFTLDKTVHYPLKRQLKKPTPLVFLYRGLRVAASLALILGVSWYFIQPKEKHYTQRTIVPKFKKGLETIKSKPLQKGSPLIVEQNKAIEEHTDPSRIIVISENEIDTPMPNSAVERNTMSVTSSRITNISFKGGPKNADIIVVADNQNLDLLDTEDPIFKIKLPKIFNKHNKVDSNSETTTVAKANVSFKKKEKNSGQKTYVDIGPLKVYKKKGVIADASKFTESENGL